MKNPFKAYQEYVKKTPRNAFDMSHVNNLTLPYGYLIPDLVLDVTAGDSMQLDSSFALNFLPTMFPVQTPIRVNQYFFYVRYRNTMKNYKDMRYGNKSDIVHPYLNQPSSFFKTCGLADYMGIPTTLSVGEAGFLSFPLDGVVTDPLDRPKPFVDSNLSSDYSGLTVDGVVQDFNSDGISGRSLSRANVYWYWPADFVNLSSYVGVPFSSVFCRYNDSKLSNITGTPAVFSVRICGINMPLRKSNSGNVLFSFSLSLSDGVSVSSAYVCAVSRVTGEIISPLLLLSNVSYASGTLFAVIAYRDVDILNGLLEEYSSYDLFVILRDVDSTKYSLDDTFACGSALFPIVASRPIDISRHPELNPFAQVGQNPPALKINALPFRAYEQIYNAFFRNERVEPFIKNGQVEYNDYGTTYADGADTTPYELKHRNWELDMLTSCLPTPQQGTAPIVGVDSRRITFSDGENNYNFLYQTNEDGTLSAEGARFEEENVPGSVRSRAIDLIANGFTIESLRNANAMQLWLEKNIRRGLRYRDQLKAHTGIDLDYDELELPEFLGGYSKFVDVNTVTSQAGTADAVLGDIAGKLSIFKQGNHKISHFFREDGVVIGLICIVPQPVYSQLLPKFYLRQDSLDYYNSEFSHLGMQPVPYKEVAPVQMYSEIQGGGSRTMESVFGYNRPNYDMVSMSDEVHGLMRTTDKDFVLMRTFDGVPELGADFLHVDGKQLNDVFTVTDEKGHIARGQVAFKIYMKRPVPSIGEPRLQ